MSNDQFECKGGYEGHCQGCFDRERVVGLLVEARERVTRAEALLREYSLSYLVPADPENGEPEPWEMCPHCGHPIEYCDSAGECWGARGRAFLAHSTAHPTEPDGASATAPKERAIEFLSGCPGCGEEPETWNTMMEEPCPGCGRTLGCNLREDDNGVKHWSFYFAFENEEPEPDGASGTKETT